MEHTKHIWRAVLILVLFSVLGVSGRHFLIPESFGQTGHFRHESVDEFMNKPVIHGTDISCRSCHKEEYKIHREGGHAAVSCETCHGPLAFHANEKDKTADAYMDKKFEQCAVCHQPLPARPVDFPQSESLEHMNEKLIEEGIKPKTKIKLKLCLNCHSTAHDP